MATRFSVLLCAAIAQHAGATVTWGLAAAGQSCTAHCNRRNQVCTPGHWPSDAFQLLRVAIAVDHTECANVKLTKDDHAPSVISSGGKNDCHYNLERGPIESACTTVPPKGARRFCPCSASGLHWLLAGEGQSCEDSCRQGGGVCGNEPEVWPKTQDALATVASYMGINCNTHKAGTAGYHPAMSRDGTCHWASSDAGQTPFCDASDWTNSELKRICPCWDIEDVA